MLSTITFIGVQMLECEWKHLLTSIMTRRKAGILFYPVSNMIGVQKQGKHHLRQKIKGDSTRKGMYQLFCDVPCVVMHWEGQNILSGGFLLKMPNLALSWENIRHTQIKGHSAKDLASSLGRCQGCKRQRPRNCHRLAEANKTWELNAAWDPGLDPAWEKEL